MAIDPVFQSLGIPAEHGTSDGPTPAPGYVAKAVHFDGSVNLNIDSLTATDNSTCSYSGWFKTSADASGGTLMLWTSDPTNDNNLGGIGGGSLIGWTLELGTSVGFKDNELLAEDLPSNDGVWHHVLASLNTLTASTTNGAIYVDGVKSNGTFVHNGNNFASEGFNGLRFIIGQDTFGDDWVGDVADLWIAPGVFLCETDGTISQANLAKFISGGKPVDPSGFPASAMLFSGDIAGFPVNQGTGGAFTLTGTLTNAGTSPSD